MKYEYIERENPCVAVINSRVSKHYEWYRTLEDRKITALHICDDTFSWYHKCLDRIRVVIDLYKPRLIIGSSMGGYAALLLGALHGIKVKAFAPQTTLKADWDIRWEVELEIIRRETRFPQYLDLLSLKPDADIYYCEGCQADERHARRMKVRTIARGCVRHEDAAVGLDPSEILDPL